MDNPNIRKIAVVLGVVLVVFLAAKTIAELKAMSYIGKNVPMNNVISVTGKGEVIATPDIAMFSFGVTEEASTVAAAQTDATKKMDAIIDYVKKSGVEEKDIKTTSYNIYPRYDYVTGPNGYGGKQVLGAYVVSQMVEVKVRKIEDAGNLLSGIGEFGATNVSGLSFTQDDEDKLVREARDLAIADAREQAKQLARSLGVRLGDILSFYETPNYPGPIYYARDMVSNGYGMGGSEMAMKQSGSSVPGGENKITTNVTITYEIK